MAQLIGRTFQRAMPPAMTDFTLLFLIMFVFRYVADVDYRWSTIH